MIILLAILSFVATVLALPHPSSLNLEPSDPDFLPQIYTSEPHTIHLLRTPSTGKTSSTLLHSLLPTVSSPNPNTTYTTPLISAMMGQEFLANVSFGSYTRTAILDTGSSDTWLVGSNFTCVDYLTNRTISAAECQFGPVAPRSSTFQLMPDAHFNISYADGEYLNGHVGLETVTFAGLTIPKQEVSLAYLAGWFGDSVSSGLLGLAFPSITSVFAGTDPRKDVVPSSRRPDAVSTQLPYSSIMNTIFFVQNLTAPIFSMALSRAGKGKTTSGYGGLLQVGGVLDEKEPTVNASSSAEWTTAKMQILSKQWLDPLKPAYQFYALNADGWTYKNAKTPTTKTQYIVDSGTTLNYVPTADATAINALFSPPARMQQGYWLVQCSAKAPVVGIKVNGTTLGVNAVDMVISQGGSTCLSGFQDGGTGPYILGDVSMVNVLAVFDVGNLVMRFKERMFYA